MIHAPTWYVPDSVPIKSHVVAFQRYIAKPLDSIKSQPAGRLVQVPPVLSAVVPLMIFPTW